MATVAGSLRIDPRRPVRAQNAGVFVSRGTGSHPDRVIGSYELILGRRGALFIAEEGRAFEVGPGDALVLWPGRRHAGTRPYSADVSFYWVHFTLPRGAPVRRALRVPQFAVLPEPERVASLFHRFIDGQESGASDGAGDLIVTLMLCEVARAAGSAPRTSGAALADRARAHIAARAHRPISTADVAEALGVNADYLGRMFRRAFGCTVVDAIHRQRLRLAKAMLMETALPIEAVAAQSGFGDGGYLRRVFRRREGMTPARFRRLHARLHVNTR